MNLVNNLLANNHRKYNKIEDNIEDITMESSNKNMKVILFKPTRNLKHLQIFHENNRTYSLKALLKRSTILILNESYENNLSRVIIGSTNIYGYISYSYEDILKNKQSFQLLTTLYNYQIWQGNNYFLFNGLIMLGCDAKSFGFTLVFTIFMVSLLISSVCMRFPSGEYSYMYLSVIVSIISYISIHYLCLTAFTEPGIINRNPFNVNVQPPNNVVIGPLGWKYCNVCNIYKPPRSKHCRYCDNCVEEFDHHCPWTGNCIGKRNYKYFLIFVTFITLLTLTALILSLSLIAIIIKRHLADDNNVADTLVYVLRNYPGATFILVFTFILIWSLYSLCCYHFYLLALGQTTNENLKKVYHYETNRYNRGFLSNMLLTCNSHYPSHITNLRESIPIDTYIQDNMKVFEQLYNANNIRPNDVWRTVPDEDDDNHNGNEMNSTFHEYKDSNGYQYNDKNNIINQAVLSPIVEERSLSNLSAGLSLQRIQDIHDIV